MIERVQLADDYSVSRIIKGGWQLAGGHGTVHSEESIDDMLAFYDAGITTFDCADIYTGVEVLIGEFRRRLVRERGRNAAEGLQIHTKFVPDRDKLSHLTPENVRHTITRSLQRLGVERLDLVQFHWWDFSIPGYVEAALQLKALQEEGLIRYIGVTNFDTEHLEELVNADVKIITNQVQYSVLDQRPEKTMVAYAQQHDMKLLCYGGLAGGFIAEHYRGMQEPDMSGLATNRSLIKYKLMIDEYGGWEAFQALLDTLHAIGARHGLTVSEIALLYVLSKPGVAATIIGARHSRHIASLAKIAGTLNSDEIGMIGTLSNSLDGDIYHLERYTERHASIMKYNLNKEK